MLVVQRTSVGGAPEGVLACAAMRCIGGCFMGRFAFRNEEEQVNLMYWVLTGRCFYSPEEWEWFLYTLAGYTGDYSLIFFE